MRRLDVASRLLAEHTESSFHHSGVGTKRHHHEATAASSSSSSSSASSAHAKKHARHGKRSSSSPSSASSDEAGGGDGPDVPLTPELLATWKELCLRCANDKVGLAGQIYDLIDTQILHIDADLKRFEQDMGFTPPNNETLNESAGTNLQTKVAPLASSSRGKEGVIDTGLPIDPNEPVYCLCQRVAFGDMVSDD